MIDMLNENPGMKSRLPNIYHFEDYSVDELMQIAESYLTHNQYVLSAKASNALRANVEKAYNSRDSKFGNGRYVINLLENQIIPNLASRLVAAGQLDKHARLNRIELVDVENIETERKDVDYFRKKAPTLGFQAGRNK
jgi:hypothetical protein